MWLKNQLHGTKRIKLFPFSTFPHVSKVLKDNLGKLLCQNIFFPSLNTKSISSEFVNSSTDGDLQAPFSGKLAQDVSGQRILQELTQSMDGPLEQKHLMMSVDI